MIKSLDAGVGQNDIKVNKNDMSAAAILEGIREGD
jgi:hypothetical protein